MSKIQILNVGLSRYLGQQRINALDEGTPRSEECELHYDDLRRTLLEAHWWDFAKHSQALAEVTNDRTSDWDYKYQRPANVLDVHWVNDPSVAAYLIEQDENPDAERLNVGEFIYCNVPAAYMEFTYDENNTDKMPQYFKNAISAMVAAAVAMPLTESVSRAKFAAEQAEILVESAIAKDEDNSPPVAMPDADYIKARGI